MTDKPGNTDIAAATVAHNSDLRDRIAYAIAQADGDLPGMEPASCDYEMADSVIEALLPKREGRWGWIDGTVSTNVKTGNPIKLEIAHLQRR